MGPLMGAVLRRSHDAMIIRRIERDWAKRIGKERLAIVRESLVASLGSLEIEA